MPAALDIAVHIAALEERIAALEAALPTLQPKVTPEVLKRILAGRVSGMEAVAERRLQLFRGK